MTESDANGVVKSVVKAGAEVVTEVAKAEQETQKTYQRGLDLLGRVGGYLAGLFEPASRELSHIFGDQMRFWRFKNGVRILEKAQTIVDERGLKPEQLKALGFGEGLLIMEAASLEEDESVQELWARLMANAVDPSASVKPEKVYIDILKSLSTREVLFLELIAKIEDQSRKRFKTQQEHQTFVNAMNALADTHWRQFLPDERAISIQNLVRLRCVTFRARSVDLHNLFGRVPLQNDMGVSVGNWAVVNPDKFQRVLGELIERQLAASGMMDFPTGGTSTISQFTFGMPLLPEANFMLTPLGSGLLTACRRENAPEACTQEANHEE
ncbi:Abi-alpha family protein [Bradyrhizobium sp. GCM10023182]|uniref:DUF4393 domain-containing protein n=1 Tax=Bradyrhizobium zhengyangense TaxID=2911009 RepID=A0ABS9LSC7_9BRAD|nr:Abi-alpha family protein [Bradyrhizobium zhengyangense]MCG2642694.1 DUF4393 domain-containing protein [Bradyrhizobium zhengyangense]MCG2669698.1 DUF4393 domain-containing protein [Bradyrhizobium zhengyangense]